MKIVDDYNKISNFKVVLWDFDGVLIDSMKIKGDGFVELFENYDDEFIAKLEKISLRKWWSIKT